MSAIGRLRQHVERDARQSANPSPATYSDPHGRHKIRLGQEMERELGHYSFVNTSTADANGSPRGNGGAKDDYTHDYSMDYRGGDSETGDDNDFFPRSPAVSTNELNKHFRDFSMHGIDSSLSSVELGRAGKEMGTPELDLKDFDRPAYKRQQQLAADKDLSAQLHSPSSHGRSASLSDFGDLKRPFSPIEKFRKGGLKDLPSDLDRELKSSSTPRLRGGLPERPRSAFVERYVKPSPPFRRPGNPVAKTIEREYAQKQKPRAATLARSFKGPEQLLEDLGLSDTAKINARNRESPTRNQSFRIPDMTGIQSLMNASPKPTGRASQAPKYVPIHSIPVPREEEDIIAGLHALRDRVKRLTAENNVQKSRVRELESELHHQRNLFEIERDRFTKQDLDRHRRSSPDSGFGSVGDADEALEREKEIHAKDKIKLENQLHTLRSKIVLLQGQLDHERDRSRRLEEERDEAVSSAGRAMNEVESLKSENRALKSEVANLKRQLQELPKSRHEPSVKERIKEQVEAERKKDHAHRTRVPDEPRIPAERGFIQPDEIEELRKEIKSLRKANQKATPTGEPEPKAKEVPTKSIEEVTKDAHGHVQTIRIQLENAKEHKDKKGLKTRRRRIQKVLVESDVSTDDDSDLENEAESSDEEYEVKEKYSKAKRSMPIQPWLRPPGQTGMKAEIQNIISGLAKHNEASCTVCSRKRRLRSKNSDPFSRRPLGEIHLNDITEQLYDEGESIRPSVPPKEALSSVLEQLLDEFHHLRLKYRDLTQEYEGLDPGRGKKRRKTIADNLRNVLEQFEAKADQIYALYDVAEGTKSAGVGPTQSRKGWFEL